MTIDKQPFEESTSPEDMESGAAEQAAPAPQAVEKEPSRLSKFMQRKFGAESPFGRFMHSFIRWTVLILGIFAVGILVSYILFGMPLARQLKDATATIESLNQSLDESTNTMTALKANLESEQDLRLQAQLAVDKVEGRYEALAMTRYVQQAQIALLQKDNAAVKTALDSAEAEMDKLDLYLSSQDADLGDTILSRLSLVQKEYVSDPVTAAQDMEILLDRLAEAEALFME